MFFELHAVRLWADGGPSPLSYSEIQAYQAATNTRLSADDVKLIRRMDNAAIRTITKEYSDNRDREKHSKG